MDPSPAAVPSAKPPRRRQNTAGFTTLVVLFFAVVVIMTYRHVDTVRSCTADAALQTSKSRAREGDLSVTQFLAAYLCATDTRGGGPSDEPKLRAAVSRLFDRSAHTDLVGLLETTERKRALEHLLSDPGNNTPVRLRAIGLILFLLDPDASIQAYQRALKADPNDMESLNQLGQLYYNQNRFADSVAASSRVVRSGGADSALKASALNNLANTYSSEGDFQKARDTYGLAITMDSRLGNRLGLARAKSNIAQLDFTQFETTKDKKLLAEARALTEQTLPIFQELNEKGDMAETEQQFAAIDTLSNDAKSGRVHAERALNLFRDTGDVVGVVISEGQLGAIELRGGDLDAAEQAFNAEKSDAERQKMPDNIADAWAGLAGVAAAQGHKSEACGLFGVAFTVWTTAKLNTTNTVEARNAAKDAGCSLSRAFPQRPVRPTT